MARSTIPVALCALVLGLADANAQSVPSRQTPTATPPSRGSKGASPHRAAHSASPKPVRERTVPPVHRDNEPPTLEDRLRSEIEQIWSGRYLRRGTTAVYVVDVATGKALYAVHEDERLNPASNVKLIATATALSVLGHDWRYATRVLGPTPSPEGVVTGDVYLLGSFDPTLATSHIGALARSLAESGIVRIDGGITVGPDELRDSVSRPRLYVTVRGGATGELARVEVGPTLADAVRVEVKAKTGRKRKRWKRSSLRVAVDLVENEDSGPFYRVEVRGSIPAGRKAGFSRVVPRGPQLTAHLLRAELQQAGVTVTGPVQVAELGAYTAAATTFLPVELGRHESAPLAEMIARINKRSLNFLADRMIMTVGAVRYGGEPTMDKGVEAMSEWLREHAEIDPGGLVLDTGSGLSYKTELTARQIVRVLRTASGHLGETTNRPLEQAFRDSLAVGGVDGTLRYRFRGSTAHGKMIGKTGTLTRVISLSGIVAEDDQALAFSLVTNGHKHRQRGTVRKQHERMVEAMYRYLKARKAAAAAASVAPAAESAVHTADGKH